MRGSALFVVLIAAKVAMAWRHGIPLSPWGAVAFTWQEAAIGLALAGGELAAKRRPWLRRTVVAVYWALAGWAVVNIPIGRVLGTPLTWPMLQATGGALSDSLRLQITAVNVLLMLAVTAIASVAPRTLARLPGTVRWTAAAAAIAVAAIGPWAVRAVDAHGMDRSILIAFTDSVLPHVSAASDARDWRRSPFESTPRDDLSMIRGAARGRNVVIVSLESTAAQYLPMYGGGDVTPALASLARDALVFDRAYAAYPESIKGLFSILCSTFPAFDVNVRTLSRAPCQALPELLHARGYATALFHSGRFDYLGMPDVVRDRGFETLEDAGDIGGNHQSSFGVDEPATVDRMLRWIDHIHGEHPFLLTYLPIEGHHPYETQAPGIFGNGDDFSRYRNAVRDGDASLGVLREGLLARGLDRNTIWIVFGDHGEAFGQHPGNYGHTFFVYDENVHVPLVIAAPGVIEGQRRVAGTVSLVDVAPTILDLLGIAAPRRYQGRSVLDGTPRMALFSTDYSLPLAGLVDGSWKAIEDLSNGRTQLFDLARDAAEAHDVASAHADRARAYAATLQAWAAAQKAYVLRPY